MQALRLSHYLEKRPHFSWWAGLTAAGGVLVLLLLLNAQRTYEGLVFDDSPFADTWQFCERFEYGWPVTAFAVPLESTCTILPAFDWLGLPLDLGAATLLIVCSGLLSGAYQRRTFHSEPNSGPSG